MLSQYKEDDGDDFWLTPKQKQTREETEHHSKMNTLLSRADKSQVLLVILPSVDVCVNIFLF